MNYNQMGMVGQKLVEYSGNSPYNVALNHFQNFTNPAIGPMGSPQGRATPAIANAAQLAGGSKGSWMRHIKPNNPQGLVAQLMQEEQQKTQPKYAGDSY